MGCLVGLLESKLRDAFAEIAIVYMPLFEPFFTWEAIRRPNYERGWYLIESAYLELPKVKPYLLERVTRFELATLSLGNLRMKKH
jgi:hypothetical protein